MWFAPPFFFCISGDSVPSLQRCCVLAFPKRFLYQNAVCITCVLSLPHARPLVTSAHALFQQHLAAHLRFAQRCCRRLKSSGMWTPQDIPESSILTHIMRLLLESGLGQGPVAVGRSGCSSASSWSIKFWLRFFLNSLSSFWLLKKQSCSLKILFSSHPPLVLPR